MSRPLSGSIRRQERGQKMGEEMRAETEREGAGKTGQAALRYQAQCLHHLLQAMHKCCEAREDHEQYLFGLPCSQTHCLLLFSSRQHSTLTQVSRELGVAKSRAAALIDALVAKGLAQRGPDPNDSRIKLITLTRAGRAMLQAVQRFQASMYEQVLQKLSPQERDQVLTGLEKLKYCLELVKEEMGEEGK